MGFKLKNIVKAAGAVVAAPITGLATGGVLKALGDATRADAPNLPGVPQLREYNLPEFPQLQAYDLPAYQNLQGYGDVADLTPEERSYLSNREQILADYRGRLNAAPTGYDTTNDQIAAAEQARYLEALKQQQGQLSLAQQQARQQEFERVREAAGRRGIRIDGDDPSTATSTSTAGNQLLSEFNKRYSLLADEQRRSDLSFGANQNLNRMGFLNKRQQDYYSNALNLSNAYSSLQDPYTQLRLARDARGVANVDVGNQNIQNAYNRAYEQSKLNTDIANQYRLGGYDRNYQMNTMNTDVYNQGINNTYQRDYNQAILNAEAKNQTRSNRLGLFNSIIGAGATIGGAMVGGPAGAAAGGAMAPKFGTGYVRSSPNRLALNYGQFGGYNG